MSRHKCNIGWGFLPLVFAATAILTFLACYLIAVSLDHVIPFVPYISDTGAYPPESCLFSQFLNVAAALGILAIYIRWKSLKKLSVENVKRFSCLNTSSFVIGVLAAIGLSIVGNFQWTSQFEIHIIGAGMAFGLGLVYCWMQSHLTYKLHPRYNSLWIARLRVIVALMVTLSLISMWVSQTIFILFLSKGLLPAWAYSGNFISQSTIDWLQLPISITHNATLNDTSTESKSLPPAEFLWATIFEWLAAIFIMFYYSTYSYEFLRIQVKVIVTNKAGNIQTQSTLDVSNAHMLAGSVAMNFVGEEDENDSASGIGDNEYAIDPEISWAYLMTTISEWALAVFLLAWFGTLCVEYTDVWLKTKIGKHSEKPLEEDENVNVIVDDGKSKDTKF